MAELNVEEMKRRTKALGVTGLLLSDKLPRTMAGRTVAGQISRSASSVGANYRAARRARSKREFIAKLRHVEEEAGETLYWLELAVEAKLLDKSIATPIWREANEILSIVIATIISTRRRK